MSVVFLGIMCVVTNAYVHGLPLLSPEETTAFNYFERIGIPEAERIKEAEKTYIRNNTNRIVGGESAKNNQIPYQAGLIIEFEGLDGRQGVCGASLLSSSRLVTAAHCWYDGTNQAKQYTVVLGSQMLFSGGTRVKTSNVTPHPKWDPSIVRNDVAIIKLNAPAELSESIQPIKLPSGSQLQEDYAGSTATVSGFGKTSDSISISKGQFLSSVSVDVTADIWCSLIFPGVYQNTNICTSGLGGKGPCGGDSGGPLIVAANSENILIGIVSFGSALGCSSGFPAAYTRVTSFIDFIQGNII